VTRVSIVIPAYNEGKTITLLLDKVKAVDFGKHEIEPEIIVVNDGSKDNTLEVINNYPGIRVVTYAKNRGKGGAIKEGFVQATGEIIIVQDADLEYDPEEIPEVVLPIITGKSSVVYGSRFLSRGQRSRNNLFMKHHQAYSFAYLGGRIITLCTNFLFWSSLTDEPTCYKCFSSKVIKSIPIKNNGFEWEPEVTAKILKRGIKIFEVPISYYPRTYEEGKKINWKDGFRAVWTLLKYRFVN
jgi:glycosyltransferase involved in cell wall biosynthesis